MQELITAGGANTILQDVAEVLVCDEPQAQIYLDDFLARANRYVDAEDYDSESITKLLDNHTALMKKCEDLAEETFRTANNETISELSAANLAISLPQRTLSDLTARIQEHEHLADSVANNVRKRIDSARDGLLEQDTLPVQLALDFAQFTHAPTQRVHDELLPQLGMTTLTRSRLQT